MAKTQNIPRFVIDTEAEIETGWPEGTVVYCKDTDRSYRIGAGGIIINYGAMESCDPVADPFRLVLSSEPA
jgi:hypothetical protein